MEHQTKLAEEQNFNRLTRNILEIIQYLESKNKSTRYEDIYQCFCYYYENRCSPESISRLLRKLAEQGLVNKYYERGRVYFSTNIWISGSENFPLIIREEKSMGVE